MALSQSMRDKGVNYHLNWGATLPRLKEKADEIGKDYDLAIALWKENVRECKILATMIMPAEQMLPEVVDIWMEQTDSLEIAEQRQSLSVAGLARRYPADMWLPHPDAPVYEQTRA